MRIILRVLVSVYPALRTVLAWYLAIAVVVVMILLPFLLAVLATWLFGG